MYDIITIGSATVDVFVKAKEEVRKHENHTDVCYHLGEKILIEDIEFNTGGGGTNTAVAFSRLGLKTGYIGAIGNDENGKIILRELKKERVDFLGSVKDGKSGYSVILCGGKERTILSFKGVNNELSFEDIKKSKLSCRWVFISTMLGKGFETAERITDELSKRGIFIGANISIYLAKKGIIALSSFLKNCDVLILNKEEALALTRKKAVEDSLKELMKYVKKISVVTDGKNPVVAYDGNRFYLRNVRRARVIDKTGAGDAFAAGFLYGIIKGKSVITSLDYGNRESVSVLEHVGAKNNLLKKL